MKITNPVLNELYERVCKQLEKKDKTQAEVKTELTKQKTSKKFRNNQLEPDMASTIEERVKLKFSLMNNK